MLQYVIMLVGIMECIVLEILEKKCCLPVSGKEGKVSEIILQDLLAFP
jgi:hypothetical protein